MSPYSRSLHGASFRRLVTKEQKAHRTQVVMAAGWYSLGRLQRRLGPMTVRTLLRICKHAHLGRQLPTGLD